MKLVHRSSVEQLIQPDVDRMVDKYLRTQGSLIGTEEIKLIVKDSTKYAIFSHRWLRNELTFQDLSKLESISAAGFSRLIESPEELKGLHGAAILQRANVVSAEGNAKRDGREVFEKMKEICECMLKQDRRATDFVKLVKFCEAALWCKCDYVWLDTGCINKQSSTELEESIRSMFRWYQNSEICIVHLGETTELGTMLRDPWFTRGWTLQELLAPKAIKFYSQTWLPFTAERNDKIADTKSGICLWEIISEITGIPQVQLLNFEPGTISVRERMVWVSKRKTTRIEDMAYCLIGIFNIPLSIAYGEGQVAFHRLQVEIVQRSHDRGLFVWSGSPSPQNSMFAKGPEAFLPLKGSFLTAGENEAGSADPTYALTSYGLRIQLSIYDVRGIKPLGEHGGAWTYNLEVPGLEAIEVAFEFKIPKGKHTIGILGNILGNKSPAIALILLEISSRRYKRMATKDVIKLPSARWKAPEVIFIE
jgi:hypothetical protein